MVMLRGFCRRPLRTRTADWCRDSGRVGGSGLERSKGGLVPQTPVVRGSRASSGRHDEVGSVAEEQKKRRDRSHDTRVYYFISSKFHHSENHEKNLIIPNLRYPTLP